MKPFLKYQNIFSLSTDPFISNYRAKIWGGFQNFKSSVNLFGAYSAVLFDTDFSLTKRGFATNAKEENFLLVQEDDVTISSLEECH